MTADELREAVARAIAIGMGDDFDSAFTGKAEWIEERGEKGGRYRDINEPFQADYHVAADAAISTVLVALEEPTEEARRRGAMELAMTRQRFQTAEDGAQQIWSAMLSQLRKELTNGH